MSIALWTPSREYVEASELHRFKEFAERKSGRLFDNYEALYRWSVEELESFWAYCLEYFDIDYSGTYGKVLDWDAQSGDFIAARWFEGITLNYAEHIFKQASSARPALKFGSETEGYREVSWNELAEMVSALQQFLVEKGIGKGDRVVGVLNNRVETIAIFLAVNSLGAIWSCCSPDFGDRSVLDRFTQIEPKALFIESKYQYNDKPFSKAQTQEMLQQQLPSLRTVVDVCAAEWRDILTTYSPAALTFTRVPFSHPLWILYSSGTTGSPKAITHSTGGNLLEHYKALALHQNVQSGENFLWYSTTGWMMWNYALSSLLCGATLCLFDGAINHNDHQTFWEFLRKAQVDHFGAGASYFSAIHDLKPGDFQPKVIGSTGSPLPTSTFENLQMKFPDVHVISLSGGTDVCSAFLSGSSMLPVFSGQLQCRALGAAIEAYNDEGQPVYDEVGELVIEKPMPSMPLYFWNDTDDTKYRESYFDKFPQVWSHGDWIKIQRDEGITIYGRSDATLNRGGVRIGTAEIYNAMSTLSEIRDSLVICVDHKNGSSEMLLFVVLEAEGSLNETLKQKIKSELRTSYSPRHIPDKVFAVQDIPYTLSGKKLELPIKKLFAGLPLTKVVAKDVLRNPDSLNEFVRIFEQQRT